MSNSLFTLSKMAQEQISKLLVDNNNAIGLKIGLSTKGKDFTSIPPIKA